MEGVYLFFFFQSIFASKCRLLIERNFDRKELSVKFSSILVLNIVLFISVFLLRDSNYTYVRSPLHEFYSFYFHSNPFISFSSLLLFLILYVLLFWYLFSLVFLIILSLFLTLSSSFLNSNSSYFTSHCIPALIFCCQDISSLNSYNSDLWAFLFPTCNSFIKFFILEYWIVIFLYFVATLLLFSSYPDFFFLCYP